MKSYQQWMDSYAVSHQNKTNKRIHVICVPVIMWSLLGLLWLVPVPFAHPWLNCATLFAAVTLPFYLLLSVKAALTMLTLGLGCFVSIYFIEQNFEHSLWLYIGSFVVAWVGQFIGHKIEGQKPSFFEDLQFLLIGPLWVLRSMKIL